MYCKHVAFINKVVDHFVLTSGKKANVLLCFSLLGQYQMTINEGYSFDLKIRCIHSLISLVDQYEEPPGATPSSFMPIKRKR
jgi:hypothetical protein